MNVQRTSTLQVVLVTMASILQFRGSWNLQIPLESENTSGIESEIIGSDGTLFQLHWTPSTMRNSISISSSFDDNENDDDEHFAPQIILQLLSLPSELGSIEVNYSLHCNEIDYHLEHRNVEMKTDTSSEYITCDFPESALNTTSVTSLCFEYDIEILTRRGVMGGVFSSTDKPIFVKSNVDHKALVSGFIGDLYEFDANALHRAPKAIYKVILQYFMMMLLDGGQSTEFEFEWRFTTKSDVSIFKQSTFVDVMTSAKFSLNGCVFYLELTPDGWGRVVPEQHCCLWLAVSSLPDGIDSVKVGFTVKCAQIGFEDSLSSPSSLHTPDGSGTFSVGPKRLMARSAFDDLQKWTFECKVTLFSMKRNNGKTIRIEADDSVETNMETQIPRLSTKHPVTASSDDSTDLLVSKLQKENAELQEEMFLQK